MSIIQQQIMFEHHENNDHKSDKMILSREYPDKQFRKTWSSLEKMSNKEDQEVEGVCNRRTKWELA